jgi:hypothetical protein
LVEHRSPKPAVGGSIPSGPVRGNANGRRDMASRLFERVSGSRTRMFAVRPHAIGVKSNGGIV